jgi:hypothetical protein
VAYQVVLADSAKSDANDIYDWVVARAPIRGPEWFEELIDCLYSLEEMPPAVRWRAKRMKHGAKSDVFTSESAGTCIVFSMKSMNPAKQFGYFIFAMAPFGTSLRKD